MTQMSGMLCLGGALGRGGAGTGGVGMGGVGMGGRWDGQPCSSISCWDWGVVFPGVSASSEDLACLALPGRPPAAGFNGPPARGQAGRLEGSEGDAKGGKRRVGRLKPGG